MSDGGAHEHAALDPAERELAARLADQRPAPGAGFRGALGRRLQAGDPGYGPRPERILLTIACYAGGGAILILVAILVALHGG